MEIFIGLAGVVLVALGIALQQDWLPPKYEMADSHPLRDPRTEPIFGPASVFDHSPRAARVVPRYALPKYKADGFEPVRIAFGRECRLGRLCIWRGKVSDGSIQECVLMARPRGSTAAPVNPPLSGREPVYASATTHLPEGLAPERVSWVRENQLQARTKVVDNAGREWRFRDPGGDLFLVHKQ